MSEKKAFPPPLSEGGHIPDAGTSAHYKTGGWASKQPTHDAKKCISCFLCWVCCPEAAIRVENQKVVGIDYEYCKGCGICVKNCPPKVQALKWPEEGV
ncbi:MAG: 4Fe-4S dicluster domain-containing protein [Planctomycetota bacterium]